MRVARTRQRAPRPFSEAALARPPRQAVALQPPAAGVNEFARQRFVRVVLVIYLLAIFEGAFRKYVTPQFGQYIFFIRDPFLICAYLLALRSGLWPSDSPWLRASVVLCGVGALLFGVQIALGGFSDTRLLLGAYGWRSYFLYVPLAFLIGRLFTADDLARFARITLWLALPIAVLVMAQFFSPMNSPINVGVAEDKALQFKGMGLDAEHVRTTGPFTSTAGLQQFVVTACGFALALWLQPALRRRFGLVPLLAATAAILTCVAFSGSRGTMLQCVIAAMSALAVGIVGRGAALKARAIALPSLLAGAAVVLYPIIFPVGFAAFVNRWNHAAAAESGFEGGVIGRALYGFIDFVRLIDVVPLFGFGIGYGSNASILLEATVDGVMPGRLAETDYARHMVDLGPLFGLAYMAFRVGLVLWLMRLVLRATRSAPDPMPVMLFAYAGYTLLLGQISGHGSINVYGWLFGGLCMAACRVALDGSRSMLVAPRVLEAVSPVRGIRWAR